MGYPRIQTFPSELLGEVAQEASEFLFPIAIKNRSALARQIATRLRYIADALLTQELYQLHPDTQDLCSQALQDLLEICKWPMLSAPQSCPPLEASPQKLRDLLVQTFQTQRLKYQAEQSITKFCKARPDVIKPLQSRFIHLSEKLESAQELLGTTTDTAAYSHLKPPARDIYPNEVHELLLDGMRRHASCMPTYHVPMLEHTTGSKFHSTRLCLNSGFRSRGNSALFNIITATSRMTYWQEMAINVAITECEPENVQIIQTSDKTPSEPFDRIVMEHGYVCNRLENPNYAKICLDLDENCNLYERQDPQGLEHIISGDGVRLSELLKQSELTVEHKIKLSYAIARAFWQLYDSEFMKARWTSQDIFFIPPNEETFSSKGMPLRAFVSFPFGTSYKNSPVEFCDKDQYTHRYPRILYLGIILLEIGLGQPLGLDQDSKLSVLAHTNTARIKANMKLKELKDADWDGFQWKGYFIEAVENCLNSTNFKDTTKAQKSRRDENGQNDVKFSPRSERKKVLYRKVVALLFWLTTVGFDNPEEMPLVPMQKKMLQKKTKATFADDDETINFWSRIHSRCSFLSSSLDSGIGFLEDLQVIAGHITRCRRRAKVTKPIRVAILDTGCKKDLPFFQDSQRSKRLIGWKDFTYAASKSETDTFGHGTFMTRLLMHIAPIVDVYLIRVAENTNELENNGDNIAKAIEWAGLDLDSKADIISMSFGFPNKPGRTYTAISEAIEKVQKDRHGSVLLLASAGNSWDRRIDFPASHDDVIPIYAADSRGTFLHSNPAHLGKGPEKLGTYGTDIPQSIIEEIHNHFPEADLGAGTSIATAIAASIVAITLSYVAALPSLLGFKGSEEVCAKLYTKSGMERMLHAMSLSTGYRQRFINPIWFWGEKEKDMQIFISICQVVGEMEREELK